MQTTEKRDLQTAAKQPTLSSRLRVFSTNEMVLVLVIIVLGAVITLFNPNFLTTFNLLNVLDAVTIVAIAAIGATFVLIAGEIDLSVGSVLGFSAIAAAWLIQTGVPEIAALPLGIVVGALVGLGNGLLVTQLGINSFIVTLGTLSLVRGLGLLITGGLPVSTPSSISFIGQGHIGQVPVNVILLLVLVILLQLLLTRATFGRRVLAVGDNKAAAFLSGIPVSQTKIAVFMIAGAFAAIAGIVRMSSLGVAEANGGQGQELDVIAAVVIGGTSLSGGRGSVTGSLLGACLLGVIRNAFVLLHLSPFFQTTSIGAVIVLAALLDQIRVRRRARAG